MTIESIFISTIEGKLLYYRNYSSVGHSLLEDFAFSLPQTLQKNAQHTFSVHGAHRLIYLPIDEVYLVLVTGKNSNIIEDIESVSQMREILGAVLGQTCNEESVFDHYVDLTLAFDDMINLGLRNAISKSQLLSLLEMQSSNEKMHNAILENQEREARKKTEEESRKIERSKKVKEIVDKELKELDKNIKQFSASMASPKNKSTPNNKVDLLAPNPASKVFNNDSKAAHKADFLPKKGIQLGKKVEKKIITKESFDTKVIEEIKEERNEEKFNPLSAEIKMLLEERISGEINSTGEYSKFEIKGVLNIFIDNPELDKFAIHTNNSDTQKHLNIKLPPSFDKTSWSKGILTLKPKTAALQKRVAVETLKYNIQASTFEEVVPFNLNFWFSGSQFSCELELNTHQKLFSKIEGLSIHFRKLYANNFEVSEAENSHYSTPNRYLEWKIDRLDSKNPSSSLIVDFEDPINEHDVFPADIEINCNQTIFDLNVSNIMDDENREVKFEFQKVLNAKDFRIE